MGQPKIRTRSRLEDVALSAGVSASTVSSVLAGNYQNRRISEETRKRVMESAQRLQYTPNLLHRSIRRGRTNVISVFNAFRRRDRDDLYLDRMMASIEEAGGEIGYNILVHTNYKLDLAATYESLTGGFSDGLILFGSAEDDPLLPLLRESTLPTVLIASRHVDPAFINVLDDEAEGMRLVAENLVGEGHRRIAAITYASETSSDPTGRIGRLRKELSVRGVALPDENVLTFHGEVDDIAKQVHALDPLPTALFIWHDGNAYRILDALEGLGLSVPGDLSVIGYDGIHWPCKSSHTIASVLVPMDKMAQTSVHVLDQLLLGNALTRSLTIPVSFSRGTTLGPPRQKSALQ